MFVSSKYPTQFESFILTFAEAFASVFIVYFICFTFGATLIEDFFETLLFSIYMTIICVCPTLIYTSILFFFIF
jgi:hypothetical protein